MVKNDSASWARLFQFSYCCFFAPSRGGHQRSIATMVNKQLRVEAGPLVLQHPKNSSSDPLRALARRVTTKLEEGDFRGAVCTASSEDSIAEITVEVISELEEKHPHGHPDSLVMQPPEESIQSATISELEICRAIRSFPNGSSGGPDGLRP